MGPVGAEVEPLEDSDQLREAVLHLLAPAELALVVEISLVDHTLEEVAVGVGEPADDLVDPVALRSLESTMSAKLPPGGTVMSARSLPAYLSRRMKSSVRT